MRAINLHRGGHSESSAGGQVLAQWVREGGRPQRSGISYLPRVRWHAYWFEHNWQTQSRRLDAVPLPDDPVFIVGLWRSGTTALHELLAAATGWVTPQTWQCFNPSTCFLQVGHTTEISIQRPMDLGQIASSGPQEDEFASLLLGQPSVYRAFIDPRRLEECAQTLWVTEESGMRRWQDFLRGSFRAHPAPFEVSKSHGSHAAAASTLPTR